MTYKVYSFIPFNKNCYTQQFYKLFHKKFFKQDDYETKFFSHFCNLMFEKLRKKWKVNGWQLLLILCTFAIGGSLTGYVGKRLMPYLGIETPWIAVPVYILLATVLWPMMVLLVSFPFGQFQFFKGYLKKIAQRFGWLNKSE